MYIYMSCFYFLQSFFYRSLDDSQDPIDLRTSTIEKLDLPCPKVLVHLSSLVRPFLARDSMSGEVSTLEWLYWKWWSQNISQNLGLLKCWAFLATGSPQKWTMWPPAPRDLLRPGENLHGCLELKHKMKQMRAKQLQNLEVTWSMLTYRLTCRQACTPFGIHSKVSSSVSTVSVTVVRHHWQRSTPEWHSCFWCFHQTNHSFEFLFKQITRFCCLNHL